MEASNRDSSKLAAMNHDTAPPKTRDLQSRKRTQKFLTNRVLNYDRAEKTVKIRRAKSLEGRQVIQKSHLSLC